MELATPLKNNIGEASKSDSRLFTKVNVEFIELNKSQSNSKKYWFAFATWAAAMAAASYILTPYMLAASFAYTLMAAGVYFRKVKPLHTRLMGSAMIIDLAIVLTLEVQRNAIKTALGFTLNGFQQMHIAASTLALVLYFPIAYLGVKNFLGSGDEKTRARHMKLGKWAFVLRTLGFVLMFSLLWKST